MSKKKETFYFADKIQKRTAWFFLTPTEIRRKYFYKFTLRLSVTLMGDTIFLRVIWPPFFVSVFFCRILVSRLVQYTLYVSKITSVLRRSRAGQHDNKRVISVLWLARDSCGDTR